MECQKLAMSCYECSCPSRCTYGQTAKATCTVPKAVNCTGPRDKVVKFKCQYCYQSDPEEHSCGEKFDCPAATDPVRQFYQASCTVPARLVCLGKRTFNKQKRCNWTAGYQWSTALALSVTLGGFGADRFYLGHWQEGIGKLFSFGGLGVWTLVDVVMVAIRYVGPADGSLYI